MKSGLERTIERVTTFSKGLFRRPSKPNELTAIVPEIEPSYNPRIQHITPPSEPTVNYRILAQGYFAGIFERTAGQERTRDQAIAELARDPVLTSVRLGCIRSAFESGEDSVEISTALSTLLSDPLPRIARRRLEISLVERDKLNNGEKINAPTSSNGSVKEKIEEELFTATNQEVDKKVEPEKVKNYGIARVVAERTSKGIRYRIEELTEEQIQAMIIERADKIAPRDERMIADCIAVVDYLRENPTSFGNIGVKKLTDNSVVIEGKSLPLWSFNPKNTPQLTLSHPQSRYTIRTVYSILKKGEMNVIVPDGNGIYTHNQYDKKYGSGKGRSS